MSDLKQYSSIKLSSFKFTHIWVRFGKLLSDKCFCNIVLTAALMDAPSETRCKLCVNLTLILLTWRIG